MADDSLVRLYEEWRFRPKRSAGQHFLKDENILKRLASYVEVGEEEALLEVGGGTGRLTRHLLRKGRPLVVLESDPKLFAWLSKRFGGKEGLRLEHANALEWDIRSMPQGCRRWVVAANLPYSVATPLLTRWMEEGWELFRAFYVMLQKEVGLRLTADPATKAFGSLSLWAAYFTEEVRVLEEVKAGAFAPRPKVDSVFVYLKPRRERLLPPAEEKIFFRIVRAVFQSRRKTLENSLVRAGFPQANVKAAREKLSLPPMVRGETLNLEVFLELARALSASKAVL